MWRLRIYLHFHFFFSPKSNIISLVEGTTANVIFFFFFIFIFSPLLLLLKQVQNGVVEFIWTGRQIYADSWMIISSVLCFPFYLSHRPWGQIQCQKWRHLVCVGKRESETACVWVLYYRTEKEGTGPVSKSFSESLWLSLSIGRYQHVTCTSPVRISFHFLLAR